MDKMTREAIRTFMTAREEFAFKRLESNLEYQEVVRQQDESEKVVDELLGQFEKAERIAIRRHYEGETNRVNFLIQEAYIQGLRDCFYLFGFLNGNEVQL